MLKGDPDAQRVLIFKAAPDAQRGPVFSGGPVF